jgi:hypothetical protein
MKSVSTTRYRRRDMHAKRYVSEGDRAKPEATEASPTTSEEGKGDLRPGREGMRLT